MDGFHFWRTLQHPDGCPEPKGQLFMKANLMGGVFLPSAIEGSAPGPEAMAVPVACRVLGISRTKLYELMGDGSLPSVKIGRRRLVRLEAARNMLASMERAGM